MYDLSKLLIDFSSVDKKEKLVDVYPELFVVDGKVKKLGEKEAKIAICLCDLNSPFLKIKDADARLKAIFEYLGIGVKSKAEKTYFDSVIAWKNSDVVDVTSSYLQLQNNHDFTRWWHLNRLYYELHNDLNKPKAENETQENYQKRKFKTIEDSEKMIVMLKTLEEKLFHDPKMKQAVVASQIKKIVTYAEKYAEDRSVI